MWIRKENIFKEKIQNLNLIKKKTNADFYWKHNCRKMSTNVQRTLLAGKTIHANWNEKAKLMSRDDDSKNAKRERDFARHWKMEDSLLFELFNLFLFCPIFFPAFFFHPLQYVNALFIFVEGDIFSFLPISFLYIVRIKVLQFFFKYKKGSVFFIPLNVFILFYFHFSIIFFLFWTPFINIFKFDFLFYWSLWKYYNLEFNWE